MYIKYRIVIQIDFRLKRYCFNFEGNGLRYLLQELLIMISDERTECTRLFNEESETLADILEIINQRG